MVCCANFSISNRLSSPVILAPVFKEREKQEYQELKAIDNELRALWDI